MSYYVSRKIKLLKGFDKTANIIHDYVVSRYGREVADTLINYARQEYEHIIPHIPYIEGMPALNSFLRISALELSAFNAMKKHDKSAGETWEICHVALRARTEAIPRFLRRLIGWYIFTGFVKKRAKKMSGKDLGGFTFEFVDEEGDWGVNYTRCAIHEFLKNQDAEEFSPYVCLSDMVLSDAMAWGLKRTETLADGCDKCNFRFRKGAPTEISSKTPEVQATIDRIAGNVVIGLNNLL
jgi:hypothetical protein